MKTEKILLSQVRVNEANPRTITNRKLNLLIERLLVFPKMLDLRPIVIDNAYLVLGGNMRVNALKSISVMSIGDIKSRLLKTQDFQNLTNSERELLLQQWQIWLDRPTAVIVRASELSDAEKKQFIIADNASFGEWDYDALANEWDSKELVSWGVDVWENSVTEPKQPTAAGATCSAGGIDPSDLPAELQGRDITPDDLPKIQGSDEVAMERVIIVYPKDKASDVAAMLGIDSIDKVVYNFNEL